MQARIHALEKVRDSPSSHRFDCTTNCAPRSTGTSGTWIWKIQCTDTAGGYCLKFLIEFVMTCLWWPVCLCQAKLQNEARQKRRLEEECTLLDQRRWMRNNFIGDMNISLLCPVCRLGPFLSCLFSSNRAEAAKIYSSSERKSQHKCSSAEWRVCKPILANSSGATQSNQKFYSGAYGARTKSKAFLLYFDQLVVNTYFLWLLFGAETSFIWPSRAASPDSASGTLFSKK